MNEENKYFLSCTDITLLLINYVGSSDAYFDLTPR